MMNPDTATRTPKPNARGKGHGMLAAKTGLKSTLRTPKKALLFLVLLAAVVTVLTLVLCVYTAVSGYLADCDRYYHTIAELEYMGADYPDSHADDPALQASLADSSGALQALLTLPGVIRYDAEDAMLGIIPGLTRHDYQVYDRHAAVIIVQIAWWENTTAAYSALISDAPYAWGDVLDKITYISLPEGSLRPGETYVMCGHFINSAKNFLLFQPENTQSGGAGRAPAACGLAASGGRHAATGQPLPLPRAGVCQPATTATASAPQPIWKHSDPGSRGN